MPHATAHRVLFIDAYDSFTNNIIAFLETNLRVEVTTIKIDETIPDFADFLKLFSAVIAGPGPGDPRNAKDVGWIRELWKLEPQELLPVLGICLGFQSLVLAFGGTIDRLGEPRHGVVRKVRGVGEGIFGGVEEVETVQYHSLYASLGLEGKYTGIVPYDSGNPLLKCSDLRPLAWDYEMDNIGECTERVMSSNPSRVLMAVEHKSKPFFGIQFHAESICSNGNSQKVIEAWWEIAKKWRRPCRDSGFLQQSPQSFYPDHGAVRMDSRGEDYRRALDDSETPSISIEEVGNGVEPIRDFVEDLKGYNGVNHSPGHHGICPVRVRRSVVDVGEATVPSICETFRLTNGDAIILDSEMHQRHDVGRYSVIGLMSPNSLRLEYQVGTNEVSRIHNGQCEKVNLRDYGGTIFSFLKVFMNQCKLESSNVEIPFWGGLMGFISYEACLETIGITYSQHHTTKDSQRPDISFVFVERSIVIDHLHQKIHVQTIKPNDQDWVDKTASRLKCTSLANPAPATSHPLVFKIQTSLSDPKSYKSKVRVCQSAIRAGDSYELCLTNQATIHTNTHLATWPLYLRLRSLNPAPFSAYVRLGKLTLLSSSPERFLQWSRPAKRPGSPTKGPFDRDEKTISCQFRPIKGTVKRQPDPNLPPLTLAEATALLATPKERAENLMIVDLIRHDLHGVVGSGRVHVPKLMVVEEYATLFQLVSVIEGTLAIKDRDEVDTTNLNDKDNSPTDATPESPTSLNPIPSTHTPKSGIDILAASLPPGSMTGAPKLRSCEILHSLEDERPRRVYSGVLGYMDVGGGGDFSVVIRSAVRWDDAVSAKPETDGETGAVGGDVVPDGETDAAKGDEWTIGAGGAVTVLSTEEGEWEEMLAKMKSTLRLFEVEEKRGNGRG